jgi:predicted dehydrogenase
MKVLVIGLGSIAQKHIHAIKFLRPDAEIFALRSSNNAPALSEIQNIYSWDEVPKDLKFILISNPTSEHLNTIQKALAYRVPIFLEKPPLMSMDGAEETMKQVTAFSVPVYTAFNLRFYPLIEWTKNNLPLEKVLEVQVYCGSYLPEWRVGQDYRKNYSSIQALGGGVHLDLIHEMDYVTWIFGLPVASRLFLSKVSKLEIDSVDAAHYWLSYPNYNISILLNYFRRDKKRSMEIVMEDTTWTVDIMKGLVTDSTGQIVFKTNYNIIDTYVDQMRYFLDCIESNIPFMNNLSQSIKTLNHSLHDS